jgi:hypothetical protein
VNQIAFYSCHSWDDPVREGSGAPVSTPQYSRMTVQALPRVGDYALVDRAATYIRYCLRLHRAGRPEAELVRSSSAFQRKARGASSETASPGAQFSASDGAPAWNSHRRLSQSPEECNQRPFVIRW